MLLAGNNGRNIDVFDLRVRISVIVRESSHLVQYTGRSYIAPALWTQCPNLHTIIGSGLQWYNLNLQPTHHPLKGLMNKACALVLSQDNLTQKHLLQKLPDVEFAANTIITFAERTWEETLGSGVDHMIISSVMYTLSAGKNAGLRFVGANGEVNEFVAHVGTSHHTFILSLVRLLIVPSVSELTPFRYTSHHNYP